MKAGGEAVIRRLGWFALLLAALLTLASCGGTATSHPSASASATSGIYFITLDHKGGRVPYAHIQAEILRTNGKGPHNMIVAATSDAMGRFRVTLPPGDYFAGWFVGVSSVPQVTVHAGAYTRVPIYVATRPWLRHWLRH
jgi:hypothetical protein